MRQYKDSGIEWIGKIPETWAIERMKGLFTERNERDCKGKTLLSVSQYYGIRPKSETDIADSHIAESYDDYKVVCQGDFVMNIMLAWNGSYAVSDYNGMVSPAYCVFKFRKDCCEKYFHYLLRTNGYPTAFKTMSRGVIDSRLRLYPEQFYTFPVILPPVEEQQRIADYLDLKCGEIDSLVGLQEQMIEKLKAYKQSVITEAVTKGLDPNAKLVPSGIDWIGEIPEGWNTIRIKYLLRERKERSETGEEEPLSMSQKCGLIPTKDMDMIPNMASSFIGAKVVHISDLVFNKLKAHLGVFSVSKYYGLVSPDYAVYFSTGRTELKYLEYLFKTPQCIGEFRKRSTGVGAGLTRLYTADLFSILIPFPPLSEQHSIATYLDEKCADIDRLIALKQQKIEALKDYKKSIIYEAVTGKTIIE